MEALARQSCAEHPDRHAHAFCMSCRKALCQECTTQWEGIHYCRSCVGTLAAAPVRPSRPVGFVLMVMFAVAIAFALARLAVAIGVYVAGMF